MMNIEEDNEKYINRKGSRPYRRWYSEDDIRKKLEPRYTILTWNGADDLTVKCNRCGNILHTRYYELKNHSGCINCNGRKAYSIDTLQIEADKRFGKGITIQKIYNKQYRTCTKHFVQLLYNGNVYEKSVSEFLRYGIIRESKRNIDYWKHYISNKTNGRIRLLAKEYYGRRAIYKFYSSKTNKSVYTTIDNALNNPKWAVSASNDFSAMELSAFEYLNNNHIFFNPEVPVENTRQHFDIAIIGQNKFIELDGIQHFRNSANWNKLEKNIEQDYRKNIFVRNNGLILLRISYTEYYKKNLSIILDAYLANDYQTLLKYNVLLIKDKKIFNESEYYEPAKSSLIKLLAENLSNC